MILRQFTSYLISTISELLPYNTHLAQNQYVYAIRAESTKRLSNTPPPSPRSNRPHHMTFTHPQGPPLEPVEPYRHFLSGSEGLIGPPLPRLLPKKVLAIEQMLYSQRNQYVHTTNRKNKYG